MAEVRTIVFPTDFSDTSTKSLPWARRLAAILDAQLHCIVVSEEPVVYGPMSMGVVPMPTVDELSEAAEKRLNEFVDEHFNRANENVVTASLAGRPADEIVSYANKCDAAMIVMSTHGYSGLKHVVMGSTTESVLRQASCPVLVVPRG